MTFEPEGEFRRLAHRAADVAADLAESLRRRPVTRAPTPAELRPTFSGPLPEEGTPLERILDDLPHDVFDHLTYNAHPRFFGYITAGASLVGAIGDFLAAVANPNVGLWRLAPAASEIELQVVRWTAEILGLPLDVAGVLVSGGNLANLVCLAAARDRMAERYGVDARKQGVGALRLRVYASDQVHLATTKGCGLLGVGSDSVRLIPTDGAGRMQVGELARAIAEERAAGLQPMAVVATAGSVGIGAIDPLAAMAELCAREDLWFHVDGAYGGYAALAPEGRAKLHGIERADSVALDPHKWLYAPLEAGVALVRRHEDLERAFEVHPTYYVTGGEQEVDLLNRSPQNSRGWRAFKVWLQLRHHGRRGYAERIAKDLALARRMGECATERGFELLVPVELSIAVFRYVPRELWERREAEGEYLNRLNEAIVEAVQRGGEAFLSNAVVRGRYALRACIVNYRTERSDVEAVVDLCARLGERLHRELRPVSA